MTAFINEDVARNSVSVKRVDVKREDVCDDVLSVSPANLVDLPEERMMAVLGNIVKDGMDDMAVKARSRLYRFWGGSEAFEAEMRNAADDVATLLAARRDITVARQAWDALDTRGRLRVLQTMVDFACGVCGPSDEKSFLRVPRVVLGADADPETPLLRQSVKFPVRREPMLLKIHPRRMDAFEDAAEDVLRQGAYHMIISLATKGEQTSRHVASILSINVSPLGYVDDEKDMAHLRQPIEHYTTLFSIMAMMALKKSPLASLTPRQMPPAPPKLVM
ncbi:MAG TPA: hypothetical protein DCW68_03905 [Rhodospirillaceae bacterium]|nr:MAG: hypothetical protein A2018_07090 [Alphaproteobacteria bacterium GWF2_58_20]HAU29239.1 hypothetical protein [Rhodospirillaceae bacterium]